MSYSELVGASPEIVDGCETTKAPAEQVPALASRSAPAIPDYLYETYYWAYLNPRNVKLLDRDWVVRTILWQQHRRLTRAATDEIEPGQNVMQTACVYGDFSSVLAEHVGAAGRLEIFDVAEVQVRHCRNKLAAYQHATVRHQDILHVRDESYDAVCCYFLMHEMPDEYRRGVARGLLETVRPGGKLIFVDYHKPHWAHPLKLITSIVFDTLEPYAKGLWREELASFAGNDSRFEWRKKTYFGGLFQKVVATRRV